jgi:hypothetical protein
MKHQTLEELGSTAEVVAFGSEIGTMTRGERLERWATLLEKHEGPLTALRRTEYLLPEQRFALRADDSPLSLAYRDPVLRAHGLASDRLGDVTTFFDLTDEEAHHLVCDCHYSGTMTGPRVAARLRACANGDSPRGVLNRAYSAMTGRW